MVRSTQCKNLGDKRSHQRYNGEGNIAAMIHDTFALGKRKYFSDKAGPKLSTEHFTGTKEQQLLLF